MATKKDKDNVEKVEKQEIFSGNAILNKVKENGTITLNDLMEELTKTGVKDIHFEDFCFNLEKSSLDKVEKTPFEENISEIIDSDLLKLSETEEKHNSEGVDKDVQLLNCIMEGSFEPDDIERLLTLMNPDVIKNYIIEKINTDSLDLRTYVYLLMDLRGR